MASKLHSLTPIRNILFVAIFLLFSSCIGKSKITVTLKNPKPSVPNLSVSNIKIVNHQIIITGTNLNVVRSFNIKEGANNANLQIESQSSTSIIANTLSNVTFAAGSVFDFVLSSANAASTFTVNFSLCDSTLGGKGFNCTLTPNDRDVLSYDAASGKWAPRAVNGLAYQGTFNASSGASPNSNNIGDYYIINVAGTIGSVQYSIGDWIVLSAVGDWEKINNGNDITTIFGRSGAVVASEGDYNLDKLSDVDLTIAPTNGDVLKYNGTKWIAGTVSGSGGGTVTSVTGSAPISIATGTSTPVVSISQATTSTNGYLSSTDWNTFNNKISAASPALTGIPIAPTAVANTNTTQIATTAFVMGQAGLLSPLAGSSSITTLGTITSGTWNGTTIDIANGGTGATTASNARTALGLGSAAVGTTGSLSTNIPVLGTGGIVGMNICSGDNAGAIICTAMTSSAVAGAVSDETGSGALVFGSAPTISNPVFSGQVGLGTATPATTALFDMTSTTKGILIPRMTTTQRDAIATPATGLQVYNITTNELNYYNGTGWQAVGTGTGAVTSVTSANTDIAIATTTSTPVLTLNVGTGANQIVKLNGSSQLPAIDGSLLTSLDPTHLSAAVGVAKGGTGVTTLTSNGVLLGNGTSAISATTAGSADQVLRIPGAGGAPAFGAIDLTKSAAITGALPIANGGTGATTATDARTALGIGSAGAGTIGALSTNIPILGTGGIVGTNLCGGDNAGGIICTAMTSSIIAGSVSDESGTGALLFGTSPTISNPVITNISPAADFTITQNTNKAPFTSVNAGAADNTLYLKAGSVGMGTANPSATALLDMTSTAKGVLIPRMTTAQRDAITTPATGLQVYNTTTNELNYYNGSSWQALGISGAGLTSLNALTGSSQSFANGFAGTTPAFVSATSTHTLNIPMASTASVTAGLISKTDYDAFTAKQSALTNSAELASALSDETGTGVSVFSASPTFTGVPLAPTAAANTNTTQIATTAFVMGQAGLLSPLAGSSSITTLGTITSGIWNGTTIAVANGGTGSTTASVARTALGIGSAGTGTIGSLSTNIPILGTGGIVGTNLCGGDNAGGIICTAMTSSIIAGSVSDESGTGALLFGTSPTISNPVITNISPGANFTLTQNSVAPFTSVNAGAVTDTLYLKAGQVGIATTNPTHTLEVNGSINATSVLVNGSALVSGGLTYQAVSANYSVTTSDNGKFFATTNGPTITLPGVATVSAGFQVIVKQTDTNSVTVNTTSSQTIDGATSVVLPSQYSVYTFVNTGSQWLIASKYGLTPALIALNPTSLSGIDAAAPTDGSCQNTTVTNSGQLTTSAITVTVPASFTKTGCTDTCTGQTLIAGASCTVGVKALGTNTIGAVSGTLQISATTGGSPTSALSGTITDYCAGSPAIGATCAGGNIYIGSLSPGATSGSGINKYMTTPGGCGEIPAGQKTTATNTPAGDYPSADFTPTCSGTDSLTKYWNDGSSNWAVVAGLTDYTTTTGTASGSTNTDANYGSANTTNIVAVTAGASGGYHAAARYCDKLSYGGYTDWYLPNRYELNLMNTNKANIAGLDTAGNSYWSSTEYNNSNAWIQRFSDGYQTTNVKNLAYRVRCVRRF